MSSVVAVRPPTLTRLFGPKTTPAGLTSITWPLASSRPMIREGSCPSTRLSAMLEVSGWRKVTPASAPMSKRSQVAIMRAVSWRTVISAPARLMAPAPAVIRPPVGRASGAGPSAQAGPAASRPAAAAVIARLRAAPRRTVPEAPLPAALAYSCTTTIQLRVRLQMTR